MNNYQTYLETLRKTDTLRRLRDVEIVGSEIVVDGKRMLNLSSNDYMGVGANAALWREFLAQEALREDFGGGACSSRLLTGNHAAYASLEARLAAWYGAEAALVFESGYHANIGILPAITSSKDLIVADKYVHASLIDGIRLSAAECVRYRHNDWEQLESVLRRRRGDYEKVVIVTESVFSMDGDRADLRRLVDLKQRFNCLLYIDEAHAVGVLGERGLGLAEEEGVLTEIDLLVGTFGKAVASQGAFVACEKMMREYLVNTMRPLIFSTALPPISVRWTEFSMARLIGQKAERQRLAAISERLRNGLTEAGFKTAGQSPVVPLITGDNVLAVRMSEHLQANGFFVLPIRPPTVPAGGERLRFSLTTVLTEDQIDSISARCKVFGN